MSEGQGGGLPYQAELLSDPWRLTAWKRAIEAVIRPGDVVLDVGTGTGILAVLAARAGASRVIAVEAAPVADVARQVFIDNHVQDRVELVHADIATREPEPVDVILADFIGRLVPDGAMLRAVRAATAWSTPATRWMPDRVELRAAVLGDVAVPAVERFEHPLLGVDLRAAAPIAHALPWSLTTGAQDLLGPPAAMGVLDPRRLETPTPVRASLEVRGGVSRGILTWFRSRLTPSIALDTGPGRRSFWAQVIWPFPRITLPAGAQVQVEGELHSLATGVRHDWRVRIAHGRERLLDHEVSEERARSSVTERADDLPPAMRPRLLLPELLAEGVPTEREALATAITALYQVGDPAAMPLLVQYERRFGPHPALRSR